jgi:coenzyme F420-reducing hydrogenase delta subunit
MPKKIKQMDLFILPHNQFTKKLLLKEAKINELKFNLKEISEEEWENFVAALKRVSERVGRLVKTKHL